MAIYKVKDLLHSLNSAKKDGIQYVELSELEPQEEDATHTLFLEYLVDAYETQEDTVDAVPLPDHLK